MGLVTSMPVFRESRHVTTKVVHLETLVRPCQRQGRLDHPKAAGGRRFPEKGFLPGLPAA